MKELIISAKPGIETDGDGRERFASFTNSFVKIVDTLCTKERETNSKRIINNQFVKYAPSPAYGQARTAFLNQKHGNNNVKRQNRKPN